MRALNVKAGNVISPTKTNFPDDRQICWYAVLEKSSDRTDWKWNVGTKHQGHTDECSFLVSDFGDIADDLEFSLLIGEEMAVKLISLFKSDGESSIQGWIDGGCRLSETL